MPNSKTFLWGLAYCAPLFHLLVEPCNLILVVDVLLVFPFEPLRETLYRFLSLKVAFLVAITFIRRVSELAALSCKYPLLLIRKDKVVLHPIPSLFPKVVSAFHKAIPSFCPSSSHLPEYSLHCL